MVTAIEVHLDGQVLENPSNSFKGIRSIDIGQRDICFQDEAVSPGERAVSVEHFELECNQKSDLLWTACTGTLDNFISASVVLTSDALFESSCGSAHSKRKGASFCVVQMLTS